MAGRRGCHLANAQAIALNDVPHLNLAEFRREVIDGAAQGLQVAALFGQQVADQVRLYAVLIDDEQGLLCAFRTEVGDRYASMTPECPQVHWFEREIAEQWGVVPEGHPWLKPIRFHRTYRPPHDAWGRSPTVQPLPSVIDFYRVEGSEVHEVGVGPVHAGVIEPGHFRFQCHGEHVFHLEISLGFQHRGIERALVGGPTKRTMHYMETMAGDTSIGHGTAYCQAMEALAGIEAPLSAQIIRGIALELERLANHTGDLGALAQDIGYLPTESFCGRLRGDFLNATGTICGSRFGRGLVRPGGVMCGIDTAMANTLVERLTQALTDVKGSTDLLWETLSVQARFEETGAVSRSDAEQLGLVGMAARACGVERDIRHDLPSGVYRFAQLPVSTWHTGDVFARAYVRGLEIQRSGEFVLEQLQAPIQGELRQPLGPLKPNHLVASLVEGWRGEICHVAITDSAGQFAHYKVVDPSFHNWIGLAMALRGQQISDFPVCNKSFNLSYCGHDL